ncbi:MAG: TetR/AcrR family transcriptional regulator [Sphingorhabdus sp.]
MASISILNVFGYYIDIIGGRCQIAAMAQREKFHHGDLRHTLIEAGHSVLNEGGVDQLSLRDLSTRAGVSQSAPYRHFKNKEALLQELIDGGLRELMLAYQEASDLAASPKERLRRACHAYLAFAADRPGLFQLVFESNGKFSATSISSSDDSPSFILFVKMVAAAAPALPEDKRLEAASACWSVIHGFASLKSHGEFAKEVDETSLQINVVDIAIAAIRQIA